MDRPLRSSNHFLLLLVTDNSTNMSVRMDLDLSREQDLEALRERIVESV